MTVNKSVSHMQILLQIYKLNGKQCRSCSDAKPKMTRKTQLVRDKSHGKELLGASFKYHSIFIQHREMTPALDPWSLCVCVCMCVSVCVSDCCCFLVVFNDRFYLSFFFATINAFSVSDFHCHWTWFCTKRSATYIQVLRHLQIDLVEIIFIWCLKALSLEFWIYFWIKTEQQKKKKKMEWKMPGLRDEWGM